MSVAKKDGGPAFPTRMDDIGSGMSLRDWFAGQELAGNSGSLPMNPDNKAKAVYEIADAMLAAREK